MNLQNKNTEVSFRDCTTLPEIKARMMSAKIFPSKVSHGSLPAWYVHSFNSLDAMNIFLDKRVTLMTINRADKSEIMIVVRAKKMGEH